MTVDIKKHEMLAQVIENRMTIHQDFFANQFCFTIKIEYPYFTQLPLHGMFADIQ